MCALIVPLKRMSVGTCAYFCEPTAACLMRLLLLAFLFWRLRLCIFIFALPFDGLCLPFRRRRGIVFFVIIVILVILRLFVLVITVIVPAFGARLASVPSDSKWHN